MILQTRWATLIVALGVVAVCGYQMAHQPLFGWWTLPFLSAIWAAIVLYIQHRYNKRWLLLSTLSGVLLALGFPTSPVTAAIFVAFVPLLMVEREISEKKRHLATIIPKTRPISPDRLMKYAFNTFIIWNIGATWWVANAGLVAGMVANYLNAFFMAGVFWLFHKKARHFFKKRGTENLNIYGWVRYTIFIIIWLAFEFLHLTWELSWPWLTLGNALADRPELVQWYEFTGTLGGSLWILILNVIIFKLLSTRIYTTNILTRKRLIIASFYFIIPAVISLIIYVNWTEKGTIKREKHSADVLALQPNFEPHYEKFEIPPSVQMQKILKLSAEKLDSNVDYLILPETSFDFGNVDNWNDNDKIKTLKEFIKPYPKLNIIIGVDALKIYAQYVPKLPPNMPAKARKFDNQDGTFTFWESYNAATQISNNVSELPIYKKSKLVPGPEILPYGFLFSWAKPIFDKFGGTVGGLGTQPQRTAFSTADKSKTIAPVICYESIYGDYCRGYVQAGAQALFIITNDGWWDNTPGYLQHRAFARLRAIELRRSVVRSANTGSSCVINLRGDVEQSTPYGVDATVRSRIALNDDLTFYVEYGDIIGWLSLLLAGYLALSFLFSSSFKQIKINNN